MITIHPRLATESTLYLDIHHVNAGENGEVHLCAILGDGWYEGEVILEIGDRVQVTFADIYLDENKIQPFLQRWGRGDVESALADAVLPLEFSMIHPGEGAEVVATTNDGCTCFMPHPHRASRARKYEEPAEHYA